MRAIRASEIGTFLFCRRAWRFYRQGTASQNQVELSGGSAYHQKHGRQVVRTGFLRAAGWLIFAMAILLLAAALTLKFLV